MLAVAFTRDLSVPRVLFGMEIAGLAVGLASLYTTIIETVHRVESYKNYEVETRQLSAQFKADKVILERWADEVGIRYDGLSDTYDRRLDDPKVFSSVQDVLLSLRTILERTDGAPKKSRHNNTNRSLSSQESTLAPGSLHATSISSRTKDKLSWIFGGKEKFAELIDVFSILVEKLGVLVPIDRSLGLTYLSWQSEKVGLEGAY